MCCCDKITMLLVSPKGAERGRRHVNRRGQSLVEFAVVALVVYMLLAAILTFGQLLYCCSNGPAGRRRRRAGDQPHAAFGDGRP